MKRVLLIPFYLVQLFTGAKSFRDNPVIGSVWLNKVGLHTVRVRFARGIMCVRWFYLSLFMPKEYRVPYHRDGFVVIPDFINADTVQQLVQEIGGHEGPVRQLTQGDTATQRILLDQGAVTAHPALHQLTRNKRLSRYLAYCAAKVMPPLLYIQRIRNSHRDGVQDPQKNMHADTFHPTMKAWLFLEDVTEDKGPFNYVKGSHKFTPARRRWEKVKAVEASRGTDKYSEKGSFRATAEDLTQMGLPEPEGVTVKAGTLVIANTNGFHGRGSASAGASRLEIWAYGRHNPFNPLPGIDFPGLRHIRHAILQWHWQRLDARAEKHGGKASWHLIPAKDMLDDIV